MRALVISDIHSNLPALEAVLAAAPQHDVVWNLGDIVGYGANPNEVVKLARSLGGVVVRGNHDRACSGDQRRPAFMDLNQTARAAAIWTREVLSKENIEWLAELPQGPVRPEGCEVEYVHGVPYDEDEYLIFKEDAWAAFHRSQARIIFCGHTHRQGGWSFDGCEVTPLRPGIRAGEIASHYVMSLDMDARYVLNPGSVGQPRDGDWRAGFAIYDDHQSAFTWCRVSYKVLTAQRRIRRAGLPDVLADRLREGT